MIQIEMNIELDYVVDPQGADFMFNIHAAHTPQQSVLDEQLFISQLVDAPVHTNAASGNRYLRLHAIGPPDHHAYVEAYLGDRWYIFDPSGTAIPMAFVRFGTGRDAADVAFATIFGNVQTQAPIIRTWAVEDAARGFELPHHCVDALSTDSGPSLHS
ncbi:MAG: hypothetical protein ACI83N_000859 [Hydrogenophaga sp.]|jgi:hypothetical protein